jgi:hypothetical protein
VAPLPRDRFVCYFGGDPDDPLLRVVTDQDVFVDVALQILRVVDHVRSDKPSYMRARDHHHARADEATSSTVTRRQLADAPLAAIRALVRDAKAALVDVADAHHMATLV